MTSHLSFEEEGGVLKIVVRIPRDRWMLPITLFVVAASVVVSALISVIAVLLVLAALRKTIRYELVVHQQCLLSLQSSSLISHRQQLIGADRIIDVFVNEVHVTLLR